MISSEEGLLLQFHTIHHKNYFHLFIPKKVTFGKASLCCVKMNIASLSVKMERADAIQELLTGPEMLRCFCAADWYLKGRERIG